MYSVADSAFLWSIPLLLLWYWTPLLARSPLTFGDGDNAHCTHCGYCLRGNVTGRCPECGSSIQPADGPV